MEFMEFKFTLDLSDLSGQQILNVNEVLLLLLTQVPFGPASRFAIT